MSWRQPTRRATQARKPRIDREGQEQAVLVRWMLGEKMRATLVGDLYEALYHVPNGGQRNKKTAADLKRQGVKAGVSDLVVMEGRGGYLGLYLEFKATPPDHAATADSQRDWLALAELKGYLAVLARGIEEAKAVLQEYATWPATEIRGQVKMMKHGTEWRR